MSDNDYLALRQWLEQTADEPLETMAGFFDARIGDYEAHMSPWRAHYVWMAEQLPPRIQTLLDVGCGSGLELDEIFRRFPDLTVTGVDLSREMLNKLAQKHSGRALSLAQADYFRYDLGENRFDAAVAFETLHHYSAAQKQALFRKIHRALRPGGVFLECDYIAVSQAIEELTFTECRRRRLRDGIPDDVFVHFDTPLTLEHEIDALKDAGFASVEVIGFLPHDDHTPLIRARKGKNMNYELRPLSVNDGKDIYDLLQTIPADENGVINNVRGQTEAEFAAWLQSSAASARQEGIIDGWKVPQNTYWFYCDGQPVGFGKIRHFLTDKLRAAGGTLGYSIAPAFRGRGHGNALLAALLKECRRLGISRALLTILEDNAPSLAVALHNGGRLEKTENGRHYVWIDIV